MSSTPRIVNFKLIATSKDFPSIVNALAYKVMAESYIKLGDWFKDMSDGDLDILHDCVNRSSEPGELPPKDMDPAKMPEPFYSNYVLMILTMMLMVAEGSNESEFSEDNMDNVASGLSLLMMYIAMEKLAREGLIEVRYENYTFDRASKETIAIPTAKGLEAIARLNGEQE